jgi:hypothetical protein
VIVNATPDVITLVSRQGVEQDSKKQFFAEAVEVLEEIPPSGIHLRVSIVTGEIDGIAIESIVYGEIKRLPKYQEGIYYIVPELVANAATKIGRTDCLTPGALVQDKKTGVILGCLFLQVY